MTISVSQLLSDFDDLILACSEADGAQFDQIDAATSCSEQSLIFVDSVAQIPAQMPAVIVTNNEIAMQLEGENCCVIQVENVRLAQAKIKQAYQEYQHQDLEWPSIHASAVIHPSASLGEGVRIGPNVVIGQNVTLGAGTQVRANVVIEQGASIGENCIINSQVNIGYDCILGHRVNLHSGVVIGNEGFGFAQDEDRNYHRIPHTGNVTIGNDVQIGANSNVDRGTYGATIIGDGVKLDSLCHVAHNVHIDQGTLFASQACIAGSTYIGKRVMASGQVGVLDHLSVADNTVLVHRSGVTESITEPGMYAGLPAKPFKEYVRSLSVGKRLDRLQTQLKELKRNLLD